MPTLGPARLRVFYYHLGKTDWPTRDDFLSREARDLAPVRQDPYYEPINKGVSVVASLEHARALRDRFPRTNWRYAAKLEIPREIPMEQSFWEGHYTVWATPEQLLGWVVEVVPLG